MATCSSREGVFQFTTGERTRHFPSFFPAKRKDEFLELVVGRPTDRRPRPALRLRASACGIWRPTGTRTKRGNLRGRKCQREVARSPHCLERNLSKHDGVYGRFLHACKVP